jgi:DnaK suppressor protein
MKESEIQQYQNRLLTLRDQVRDNVQSSIDAVEDEVHPVGEDTKEPSEGLDKELAVEHNEENIYFQIVAALQRIDEGIFGLCTGCGKQIKKARLEAIPYAAYCVECEEKVEQKSE